MKKNIISKNGANLRSHRSKLIDAAVKRGQRAHNIWSIFSTKNSKNLTLIGDCEYKNAIWLEGDPKVVSFEIETDLFLVENDESHGATYPDAIVTYSDGSVSWREVKSEDDPSNLTKRDLRQIQIQEKITKELGIKYELITPRTLDSHMCFISNWRKANSYLAAARYSDLQRYADEVYAFVCTQGKVTLEEIASLYKKEIESLAFAAVFRCAQRGLFNTDLDHHQLRKR